MDKFFSASQRLCGDMAKAILLDIEGTTTPIDFVHRTLFPYARARVAGYVSEHFASLKKEVAELAAEAEADESYTKALDKTSANAVIEYLQHLIDADRKSTPLKFIQGLIWERGYAAGELVGEVFPDVPPAFERWKASGKLIAIYSSGSVLAQKLIFSHTAEGDLSRYIESYFDTNIGHKREAESYRRIAGELELPPAEILFISDIAEELAAAAESGMQVLLSVRPGNAPVAEAGRFEAIDSFARI